MAATITGQVGDKSTGSYTPRDKHGKETPHPAASAKWVAADSSIVAVAPSPDGKTAAMEFLKPGRTTVSATVGGVTGPPIDVTVTAPVTTTLDMAATPPA